MLGILRSFDNHFSNSDMPAQSIMVECGLTADSWTSALPTENVDNYFSELCAIDATLETEKLFNINTSLPANLYNVFLSSITIRHLHLILTSTV